MSLGEIKASNPDFTSMTIYTGISAYDAEQKQSGYVAEQNRLQCILHNG